jgi:hypothetical protein
MSWKSILPSLESGGFDLLKMGASGLLGYFLGRRSKRGSIRKSTYSGAVNLLNEYNVILSASEFPDSKFMVRAAVIDGQIAEWFSPSTYVAWREAHKFISWRGLPKEASEYDYSEAKTRALDAIAAELRSELPKKKGT